MYVGLVVKWGLWAGARSRARVCENVCLRTACTRERMCDDATSTATDDEVDVDVGTGAREVVAIALAPHRTASAGCHSII